MAEPNKSYDGVRATKRISVHKGDVREAKDKAHFSYHRRVRADIDPLCQLRPCGKGLFLPQLNWSVVMNYVAVAVVIVLVSIVYEFTVMSWVIAEQKLKQQLQDGRGGR